MSVPRIPHTALIVEANYLVAAVIEAPLLQAGYLVALAIGLDEAVAVLDGRAVHFAVLDFSLADHKPDLVVAMLQRRAIPFIFYTAATTEEVYERFPGAQVMLKPASDQDLLAAVAALVVVDGSKMK